MVFYAGEYINVKGYTYAPYARDMKPAQLKKKIKYIIYKDEKRRICFLKELTCCYILYVRQTDL